MAEQDTVKQIVESITRKESFLVEAGAGSGKTRSLIEALKYILAEESISLQKRGHVVACITYTNVAKDEIIARIDNNPLVAVSTIHEFLWRVMKNYQLELKNEIILYNEADTRNKVEDLKTKLDSLNIEYSMYGRNFENGQITHEDVIEFSSRLFDKFPKIARLVASKYPYVLIDEYQDTEERTVNLLVKKLLPANVGTVVVGFFGDSMQKIYNSGIGKIDIASLKTITKNDNYRCSIKVIELLNKMRPELKQTPAGKNVQGEIKFFNSNNRLGNEANYSNVFEHLKANGWVSSKTKVLMLTHKGIASKLDYPNLLKVYDKLSSFGRERLLKREEEFSKLIENIERLVYLYDDKRYGDFIHQLGIAGFKVTKHEHKKQVKDLMNGLMTNRSSGSIKEVFEYVFNNNLIAKPQKITDFEAKISSDDESEKVLKQKDFYDSLMEVSYKEAINLNAYIEEKTPFSTKHGVKGAEFENVIVVIDDDAWNQYSFSEVFSNNRRSADRYTRTLNLLYVCCSRAKNRLTVLCLSEMNHDALVGAASWFGANNCFETASI